MKRHHYDQVTERLFSPHLLLLVLFGLFLNVVLYKLTVLLHLPLFLDNVGSVLVAALCGPLPGMAVGLISNLLNSIHDQRTLYYGVLTILIALTAGEFSLRGWLRSIRGCLSAAVCFMLIGGGVGSFITWLLYGGGIGYGVSAPYATWFFIHGMPEFWAQFTADVLIDAADKLLTMTAVYLALRFYPLQLYDRFPLSYLYDRSAEEMQALQAQQRACYRIRSIHTRIVRLLVLSLLLLSALTTAVAVWCYQRTELEQYMENAADASRMAASFLDGDQVDDYLTHGEQAEGYRQTEENLFRIFRNTTKLAYLYVYQIQEDGAHVVFDLDTEDLAGDPCGSVVAFDQDLLPYRTQLLQGETIPPVLSHGPYGWLITAYTPVYNTQGETVAYVGADLSTAAYIRGILAYLIQLITVEFSISLLIIAVTIRYAQQRVTAPLNTLVGQSLVFDHTDPEQWLTSKAWAERSVIQTGDEIEMLYQTICRVEENVAHTVTQLRQTERRLLQAAELEHRNRELAEAVHQADTVNAAKTEFYSRMSHDMRTPMNGIIGLVELSRNETSPTILRENIRRIGEAGSYLLALINDTLDISKLEQRKLTLQEKPFYIRDFIDSLTDMLTPSLKEKCLTFTVQNKGMRTDAYVLADPLRLKQIFMNLLSNAVKFTPNGGSISLFLENCGEVGHTAHTRFVLRDTGVGMSEDFIEHGLFQSFSQEHNSLTSQYAGTGLGLAIVKNLVELMHGRIRAESRQGEGSVFTLDLDFTLVKPAQAENAPHTLHGNDPAKVLMGKHVLLCEDNALNAEIATRLLEHIGMQVTHVENGQAAVERFAASPLGGFAAILMDIRMPVMDGITAAEIIRGLNRSDAQAVPIIAITANAYLEDRDQTKAAGINAHLAKPIDTAALYETLAELVSATKT